MAELVETLTGTVVSQQANFFYVRANEQEYACFLRGKLKKSGETPVVGDHVIVTLEPVSAEAKLPPPRAGSLVLPESKPEPVARRGFLDELQPRTNLLKRPSIANVDQILLVFAAAQPPFNPLLLDKFLVTTAYNGFTPLIVLNKRDLVSAAELDAWISAYRALGYTVIPTEASLAGVRDLMPHLAHKTSVLAGPSGVGKSSLVNALAPGLELRTLDVSTKLQRGRHTTRHAALYPLPGIPGALLADTPGFSFLEIEAIAPPELGWYFPEMVPHIPDCKFPSCLHQHEPQCAVRDRARLSEWRYDSYVRFLDELLALEKVRSERTSKVESGMKARGGRTGQEERLVKVDAASREANRHTMKQQLANFDREDEELDEDGE